MGWLGFLLSILLSYRHSLSLSVQGVRDCNIAVSLQIRCSLWLFYICGYLQLMSKHLFPRSTRRNSRYAGVTVI